MRKALAIRTPPLHAHDKARDLTLSFCPQRQLEDLFNRSITLGLPTQARAERTVLMTSQVQGAISLRDSPERACATVIS